MRYILFYSFATACCLSTLLLVQTVPALESRDLDSDASQGVWRTSADAVPHDSEATARHWKQARAYQKGMRFELARQEYLLALATCRTDITRDRLQRELRIVDMQLRTLR